MITHGLIAWDGLKPPHFDRSTSKCGRLRDLRIERCRKRIAREWRTASSGHVLTWSKDDRIVPSTAAGISEKESCLGRAASWASRKFCTKTLGRSGINAWSFKVFDNVRRQVVVTEVRESISTVNDGKRIKVDAPWSVTFVWERSKCRRSVVVNGTGAGATPPDKQERMASLRWMEPAKLRWVKWSPGKAQHTTASKKPRHWLHKSCCKDGCDNCDDMWSKLIKNCPVKSGHSCKFKIWRLRDHEFCSKSVNWESVNSSKLLKYTSLNAWLAGTKHDQLEQGNGPDTCNCHGGRWRVQIESACVSCVSSFPAMWRNNSSANVSGKCPSCTSRPCNSSVAKVFKQRSWRLGTMATDEFNRNPGRRPPLDFMETMVLSTSWNCYWWCSAPPHLEPHGKDQQILRIFKGHGTNICCDFVGGFRDCCFARSISRRMGNGQPSQSANPTISFSICIFPHLPAVTKDPQRRNWELPQQAALLLELDESFDEATKMMIIHQALKLNLNDKNMMRTIQSMVKKMNLGDSS